MRRAAFSVVLITGCASAPPASHEPAAPAPVASAPVATASASSLPPMSVSSTPPKLAEDPERRARLRALFPRIDAFVAEQQRDQKAPSVCVGIVEAGELVHEVCAGDADVDKKTAATADTAYRVGSITKTFTSAAILLLRDRGKLRLDQPADELIPELARVTYPTADSPRITLRHLLTHTSGLPRDPRDLGDAPTLAALTATLPTVRIEHTPGTRYQYSNFGFELLGGVVARAAGEPYRDFVTRELLRPLGMKDAAWDAAAVPAGKLAKGYHFEAGKLVEKPETRLGETEADGGLYASTRDLARWAAFQLDAYPPRSAPDKAPLSRASRREAHAGYLRDLELTAGTGPDARPLDAMASTIGLAWHGYANCDEDATIWHSGLIDGHTASVHTWPSSGVGLVMLTNLRGFDRSKLTQPIRHWLAASGALAARKPEVPASLARVHARAMQLTLAPVVNETDYAAVFTPAFREAVPIAKLAAVAKSVTDQTGTCGDARLVDHTGNGTGVFETTCARAVIESHITIDAEDHVTGFWVAVKTMPDTRERDAAAALVGLVARWDAKVARARLAPTLDAKALATRADEVRHARGACKLGEPKPSAVAHAHVYPLTCERGGSFELAVTLDDKALATKVEWRVPAWTRCPPFVPPPAAAAPAAVKRP